MALDPLSQVYSGQDNSGAAIIYKDSTRDPIPVVLNILQKKAEIAAQKKIAAAKANAYKEVPNYVGASYDAPYLTNLRNEIIEKSRGLYDGTLSPEQKIERQMEVDQLKGKAYMMAHKSAELNKQFQDAYSDFSNHPWSYGPDFEKGAKDWTTVDLEKRGPFQYKKRNESDYVKSMQAFDLSPNIKAWDEDVANGRMMHTERQKLIKGAVDGAWSVWSSNANNPDVIALYDHADDELRKQYGNKYDQYPPEKKHELINKMGKEMFVQAQRLKLGADKDWVISYKTSTKKAPGDKPKKSGGNITGKGNVNVAISEKGGHVYVTPKHTSVSPDTDFVIVPMPDGTQAKFVNPEISIDKRTGGVVITGEKFIQVVKKDNIGKPTGEFAWTTTNKREKVGVTDKAVLRDLSSNYGDVFQIDADGNVTIDEENPNIKNVNDYRESSSGEKKKSSFVIPKGVKL